MSKAALKVSVRALVAFTAFPPDIVPVSSLMMELGRQGHLARQSASTARAETLLTWSGQLNLREIQVSGRMDLYDAQAQPPLVEEIKLAPREAPEKPLKEHLLQAVAYGFMLCQRDGLDAVQLNIAYVTAQGEMVREFSEVFSADRLQADFLGMLIPWAAWQERLMAHVEARDRSLQGLPFPYPAYRPGQREMAAQVYTAISRRKRLYAVMPTGTGKSAAALYPALKALGQGLTRKVFCLTARGTQRIAMHKEVGLMLENGLTLHALTLNAKEGLCPVGHLRCHPDHCERAKGHYLRQQAALEEALDFPNWDGSLVTALADKHQLCPFEFSLALCEIADLVICDYNYALDPQVRLSRIFDTTRNVTLLIDEAHNLPDRARDMLSGSLKAAELRAFRMEAGKLHRRTSPLYKACTAMLRLIEEEDGEWDGERAALAAGKLLDALGTAFTPGTARLVRDLVSFLGALRREGEEPEDYAPLHKPGKTGAITILNLNPAPHLAECTRNLAGCVFYSATLEPLGAMRALLGGDREDACLSLPSPFPEEHLLPLQLSLNTRYQARESSLDPAARAIRALFDTCPGKMIAYFPSFAYLRAVHARLETGGALPTLVQQPGMDEAQRLAFLQSFTQGDEPLLGLCVLGGVFSEGVDLPGRALTTVAIVGVGLPQVNQERDLFRARMEEVMGDGFSFAYRIPGMHKVLQAAGRLIRSEHDRGVLLLMDDRYTREDTLALLPAHLRLNRVHSIEELAQKARAFWQECDMGGAGNG